MPFCVSGYRSSISLPGIHFDARRREATMLHAADCWGGLAFCLLSVVSPPNTRKYLDSFTNPLAGDASHHWKIPSTFIMNGGRHLSICHPGPTVVPFFFDRRATRGVGMS